MQPVKYALTVDRRGWARIQVRPPYSLFGNFLSSIISPSRMRDLRNLLASYRANPAQYADYAHDYTDLWFEPADGVAKVAIDHPDEPQECEMPMTEFAPLAEQWLAFADSHPVTCPNKQRSHYPPNG